MPYKDHEKRLENMRKWRKKKISEGYGQALYARRKQRWENEEILRTAALKAADELKAGKAKQAYDTLTTALATAPEVKGAPMDYMKKENTDDPR